MEFDTEKLKAALMNGLDINDCNINDIESLLLDNEEVDINDFAEDKKEELITEQADKDMAYNLTALGIPRKIGPIQIDCVLGNLVLLSIIKSPFVSGELNGEVGIEDVAKALYVLANGSEVVEPLMDIAERIEDIYLLTDACKNNPELAEAVVSKVEEISKSRTRFTKEALEFYNDNFTAGDLQDVFDQIFRSINDLSKSLEEITSSSSKKKIDQ